MDSFDSLKISQLDKKLRVFKNFEVPKFGWINVIRKTLKMTYAQLANRVKTSPQVIKKFEQNEVDGKITLNSLRKIASAMNCKLVYAIVPEISLEETINNKIEQVSDSLINKVSYSMSLESQKPDKEEIDRQKNELKWELRKNLKKLWKYEI
jgi:predicted DNA-binding mobile mystery protein A